MKRKKKPELSLEELSHRERLRVSYNAIFVVTVLVWFCRFCLGGLASLATPYLNFYVGTALSIAANSVSVCLPFVLFQKFQRDSFAPIFTEKLRTEHPILRCVFGVVAVACLTVAALCLTDFALGLLEEQGVHSSITVPNVGNTRGEMVFYLVFSTLCYSFSYEFAFRGIATRAIATENRFCAILVSGIAYVLSDGEPYLIVVRLAIGFVLAAFYLRTRSFECCMVFQAVSQAIIGLWWCFRPETEWILFEGFIILIALVLGIGASFFLFFPCGERETPKTKTSLALKQILGSFGIWLMIGLVAFNMLIFTFSTDADPADPLLQPTPEEGVRPPLHFDRGEELEDYYGTESPDVEE